MVTRPTSVRRRVVDFDLLGSKSVEAELIKPLIYILFFLGLVPMFQCGSAVSRNTGAITKERAIYLAQRYLKIEDTKQYEIKTEEAVVTSETHNTYRRLEKGVKRDAWVVTFSVPNAIGSSRTVYVDKRNGEILGGFSSK